MKASFSVAVWLRPDPSFLVPVGIGFGRLKMFLLSRKSTNSDCRAIAGFAMRSAHTSIWNCCFLPSVEAFLFANELFTPVFAQEKLSTFCQRDGTSVRNSMWLCLLWRQLLRIDQGVP
jgi:hypothetical protein